MGSVVGVRITLPPVCRTRREKGLRFRRKDFYARTFFFFGRHVSGVEFRGRRNGAGGPSGRGTTE